jgi:hypothetical protein
MKHEERLDALNKFLAKDVCHAYQLLPWLLKGEACHISGGGASTHI